MIILFITRCAVLVGAGWEMISLMGLWQMQGLGDWGRGEGEEESGSSLEGVCCAF